MTFALTYPKNDIAQQERPEAILTFAKGLREMGDKAKILLATAWFEIRKEEYWKALSKEDERGYATFDEYIMGEFNYSKATSTALLGVYETYVVKLGYSPEEISDIPWFQLRALVPVVTSENAAEYLEKARKMGQREITQFVKSLRGIPEVKERTKKFSVALKPLQQEVCDYAMELANKSTDSDIPGLNLEYICSEFVCANDMRDLSREISLGEWVARMERLFGVKLVVEADDRGFTPENQTAPEREFEPVEAD